LWSKSAASRLPHDYFYKTQNLRFMMDICQSPVSRMAASAGPDGNAVVVHDTNS
jgi:hypothetical protein